MKINFTSGKFLFFVVITLIIIAEGVFLWFNRSQTYKFAGSIDTINGNIIFATGFLSNNDGTMSDKEPKSVGVEISVDSKTKLTRLTLKIPQGVTAFNTNDLEKEESSTDLETIKNDSLQGHVIGIEAVLKKGSSDIKFIGRTLYFRVPIFNNPNLDE